MILVQASLPHCLTLLIPLRQAFWTVTATPSNQEPAALQALLMPDQASLPHCLMLLIPLRQAVWMAEHTAENVALISSQCSLTHTTPVATAATIAAIPAVTAAEAPRMMAPTAASATPTTIRASLTQLKPFFSMEKKFVTARIAPPTRAPTPAKTELGPKTSFIASESVQAPLDVNAITSTILPKIPAAFRFLTDVINVVTALSPASVLETTAMVPSAPAIPRSAVCAGERSAIKSPSVVFPDTRSDKSESRSEISRNAEMTRSPVQDANG